MEQHYRPFRHLYLVIGLAAVLLIASLGSLTAMAQSGCVGDPCLFLTPTTTPTPTPLPTPDVGTPTAVPTANPIPFPQPNYAVPTSIPALNLSNVPDPLDLDLNGPPAPLSIDPLVLPTLAPAPTLASVITDFRSAIPTVAPVNPDFGTGGVTGTTTYSAATGAAGTGLGLTGEIISYTNWLSNEIAALQMTGTITITSAPDWYAPYMPRPMANIGWTFENMDESMTTFSRYSVTSWSNFFGQIASTPFSLVKSLWELFRFLGPFGLFVIWLVGIMLPTVLGFNVLKFLKVLFVRTLNLILWLIDWLIKILMWIGTAINWLLDWLWKLWEAIPFLN